MPNSFFYVQKGHVMQIYNNKDISLMCPNCGKFLVKADKEDDRVHQIACKRCEKWIWITPKTGKYQIKPIPQRNTNSGKRFF